MTSNAKAAGVRTHGKPLLKRIWDYRVIYLMLLPTVLYFVLFKCRAVWGMKLAFFDYRPRGEDVWAGLKYFQQVFSSPTFGTIILNTVKISLMRTLLNWFFPVVFALMQHEVRRSGFRKTVQVVSYLPHFLSWVVIYGIWKGALDYGGMLNGIYSLLVSFARQLVVLLPAAFLLSLTGEVNAVWWSFPIAEIASLTCSLLFLRRIHRKILAPLYKLQNKREAA